MKFKKIAACALSLTLVFAFGAANGYTYVYNDDTVCAQELTTGNLPVNNINPTLERFENPNIPQNTLPYKLTAVLDNYDFELTNGQTIDREALENHGIVITEQCGYISGAQDTYGQILSLATPRTITHSMSVCNVFIPSKLVNGLNKIYITYRAPRYPVDTTGVAELMVNVKYTDSTPDAAVKDYLPNHIDRGALDIFEYTLDGQTETCLNISPDKVSYYTSVSDHTLVYDADDIESLKSDYPQFTITEVQDTLAYGTDQQVPCKDMTEGKTYYKLDAGDITEVDFAALCSELKDSKYGNDIKLAKFVSENDPEKFTISFNPCNYDYNPLTDYRWFDEQIDENGNVLFTKTHINDPSYMDEIYSYAVRRDIRNFKVDYTLGETLNGPSYCYLQSLTSVVDSNDLTDPYAQMVIPDPVDIYTKVKPDAKPDMGGKDISLEDMTLVSEFLVKDIDFTQEQRTYYDFTKDGQLNLADLAMMKQYIMYDGVTLWPEK